MPRPAAPPVTDHVRKTLESFHADFVDEVSKAIAEDDIVVVGMAQNPHVRRARRALDDAGIAYRYIGHGSYLGGYQRRLAIKLWTGWPTFPQVFVRGKLIGGRAELMKAIEDGTLKATLADAAAAAT